MKRKKKHRERNCLFCHWINILYGKKSVQEEQEKQEKRELENRIVGKYEEKDWFAILDRNPKVLGHTLVISKYPFDDFTDEIDRIDGEHKKALFEGAIEVSEKAKDA